MLQLTNNILQEFEKCFKRKATWKWFVILVIGFMVRTSRRGITSTIADMRLDPCKYHTMLHFFRSKAYEIDELNETWTSEVVKDPGIMRISKRILANGDHSKVSKEGRRMPGMQIYHQESENSGKGEYIAGHIFAQIGVVMSNGNTSRNIPIMTELQKSPPKIPGTKKPDGDTIVVQMANLGIKAAEHIYKATGECTIGAFDAYFSKKTMFNALKGKTTSDGRQLMTAVTRAQDNYVAYFPATPTPDKKRRRGRPKKEGANLYGEKVVLKSLLKDMSDFTEVTMNLYGKDTKVKYLCLDLLWKSTDTIMRFVVVSSSVGQCVLMTDDLTLTAEEIITIYTLRFKIETSFDEQKNEMGCFDYHFWTKSLERRKRRQAGTDPHETIDDVESTKKAISAFVCLGTIATGILTIMAFKHDCEIWARYPGWVRTVRSRIPSISVTKESFAHSFHADLHHFSHIPIAKIISPLLRKSDFLYATLGDNFFANAA